MTAPTPEPQQSAPKKADAGSIGLIALVILAVIASLVMLISGSASALKLALIAALWAAVLGFFMVVRYRREAAESAALLESERARKVEPTQGDSDIMEEIRRELASIRAQIEELSGREFTYEPAALHAEARRIMELEEKTREPEVNFTQASKGAPTADAVAGRLGSQPSARVPQHNPLDDIISQKVQQRGQQAQQAQQAQQRVQQPAQAQSQQAQRQAQERARQNFGRPTFPAQGGAQPQNQQASAQQQPQAKPASAKPSQHFPGGQPQKSPQSTFDTASFQTVRWDGQQSSHSKPAETKSAQASGHHAANAAQSAGAQQGQQAQPQPQPARAAQHASHKHRAPEQEGSRGRRRSDEPREGSVSVAELMAAMKKKK